MGILRTDILSHSQLPDGNQSVEFDGTGDYLQVPASAAWRLGSANLAHKSVTIEWWVYLNSLSSHAAFGLNALSGIIAFGTNGRYAIYAGGQTLINESNSVLDAVGLNEWHHYALVIHGGGAGARKNVEFYRDGKLSVSNTYASNLAVGDSTHVLTIGVDQENNSSYLNGFISNFRWSDEIVYTSEFTVPKFKLKALPSTMLLCCQSSTSVTEAAVSVSGSVTSNGDPAVSAFGPGLKDDITDAGVVFDGVTTFDSQAFMVPPSGKTTERNRGRALLGGGHNPSGATNHIHQLSIQSQGNTEDFGDLTYVRWIPAPSSSSTRGVWSGGGGYNPGSPTGSYVNFIDFVTIATPANATDFGDQTAEKGYHAGLSNETRGIIAGGYNDSVGKIDVIEFITIATLGNAQDFGDLTAARMQLAAAGSPTRGLFFGGSINPNVNGDVVDYITIATTGNAQDFGDMTSTTKYGNATSSNTRAIYGGGLAPNDTTYVNTIEYFTIATTGDATDFGDLTATRSTTPGATSNNIRGIFAGGYVPGNVNSIDFVTIASVGHAADFGDITSGALRGIGALSDSHGGLS